MKIMRAGTNELIRTVCFLKGNTVLRNQAATERTLTFAFPSPAF